MQHKLMPLTSLGMWIRQLGNFNVEGVEFVRLVTGWIDLQQVDPCVEPDKEQ